MAKTPATGKLGKVASAPRLTRDERIDAAMREAARHAGKQLKQQGLVLPIGTWTKAAEAGKAKAGR
jgi:hypothetical protein